jgi:multiple sugar transport system substrate-binding protein
MNKWLSFLVVLLAVLVPLGGSLHSNEASAQDSITLTMSAWDVATTPYWQAVIDAYEAANPNVHIELIDVPSAEYQDTMNIRLSGGDDTDIITVKDIPGYAAMLTRGQIVPLDDYIEASAVDLSKAWFYDCAATGYVVTVKAT